MDALRAGVLKFNSEDSKFVLLTQGFEDACRWQLPVAFVLVTR